MELTEGIGVDDAQLGDRAPPRDEPLMEAEQHPSASPAAPTSTSRPATSSSPRGITKIFGGLVADDDVSFAIPRSSIVSIIGPNGAGKTTFFNMLTGLYRPTFGSITFNGDDITARRPDLIMKIGMARTFQNIRLFATMSAIENVMVGEHARMKAGLFRSILRTPGQRREEKEATKRRARCCATSA